MQEGEKEKKKNVVDASLMGIGKTLKGNVPSQEHSICIHMNLHIASYIT